MSHRVQNQLKQSSPASFTPVSSGMLQRKCARGNYTMAGGECAECNRKKQTIQRASLSPRQSGMEGEGEVPFIVHEVLRSPGQPLDPRIRAFFEPRFGQDFSRVRVHTDAKAAESARAVNALAYTVGRDVVFDARQYRPHSADGHRILAHELTHVVQQRDESVPTDLRLGKLGDSSEREADAVASQVGTAATDVLWVAPPDGRVAHSGPIRLRRLGANPNCTPTEASDIHQSIFDARGWLNKAIPKLEASPLAAEVLGSLRRNFGPTYGVAANANLIANRLKVARSTLGTIPFSCDTPGTTPLCAANHCGWAGFGSGAATICTNPPSTLSLGSAFRAGCVLHESLHAAFSFMTVDRYSGTAGYPGPGTDPLLNPDSYTQFTKDMS